MKIRIFFALSLLLAPFYVKGQPTTPADLKMGDWMELEYVHNSTPDNFWRAENVTKIRFRGTVVRKTKNDVTMTFKPIHFYWHNSSKDSYSLYDSHFSREDESFKHDSLIFSIRLPENVPHDTNYVLQNKFWRFSSPIMLHGIRRNSNGGVSQMLYSIVEDVFRDAVLGYFYQWKDNVDHHQGMPEMITLNGEIIGIVRLIETSSGMKPNVHLTYKNTENLQNPLIFTISEQKYTFSLKNGEQECQFYLSSPEKITINAIPLLLMPNDSIVIEKQDNVYHFSGKGSANCMFAQEEQYLLQKYRTTENKELETRITKMSEIYHSLWEKYEKQMNPYWLKSSQLSFKYWYILSYMERRERPNSKEPGIAIPWSDPQFTDVEPYIDYFYQPEHYERFITEFYRYKFENLRSDNMTGFVEEITTDWIKSEYYIEKTLFFGYPRLLLMKNTLNYFMQLNHFTTYQTEYDDFMQICHYPKLRRELNDLHQQLMQIEPGRKIQDINPELAKLPFLKNVADGYIIFNIKNEGIEWDLTWTENLWATLKNTELSEHIKVIALRSKEDMESLPDSLKNPNNYIYWINDYEIKIDKDFFSFYYGRFILLRNDGTIVSRDFYGNFNSFPDIIRADIAERDRKPEKSRIFIFQVILISCIVGSIFAFISGIYIKIVKMREYNKRKITELELKAIRSQMNPHFVFNALGSIQSLINQEKNVEANHYLVNFAKLLRMALSTSEKKLTPLADELEQLDLYLRLEQLRVPFVYDITVDSNICLSDEEIPGMLIQPIVENAVIHGIVPKQGGNISIRIRKEENILLVDVADDGAGFTGDVQQKNGFGIRAINERLALLNDELKTNIGLMFENRQTKEGLSGMRVTISIPV